MSVYSPTPWVHKTWPNKVSAVLDAEGKVVCGSLIAPQSYESIANHRRIAELADSIVEIAEAACVPFPDLATKDEIIEQIKHNQAALERVRGLQEYPAHVFLATETRSDGQRTRMPLMAKVVLADELAAALKKGESSS